jgi:hypothetical protein
MTKENINRREFLRLTAVGVVVAAGHARSHPVKPQVIHRKGNINGR